VPPFYEELLRLNLSDQKALTDDGSSVCTARFTRPRLRRSVAADGNHPAEAPQTIEIFPTFEKSDPRAGAFGISVLIHIGMLLLVIVLPLIFTSSLKVHHDVVLVAPPVEKPVTLVETTSASRRLEPPREPAPAVIEPLRKAEPEPKNEVPIPKVLKVEDPAAPVPAPIALPHIDAPPAAIAPPRLAVQTGVFSTKSDSAAAMPNAPAHDVQTGGFGNPNGVPAKNSNRAAGIAVGGSFAAAAPSSYPGAVIRSVRQGGFDAVADAAPLPAPKKMNAGPPDKPVEIVYKPKPEYTEEARKLRVEGEVLVHVLFKATDEISVLDVVRGLGHGLDETAMRAAGQIRFKPAMRAGQPVDSAATVHIIFQLAF
jgi:TonB family protein